MTRHLAIIYDALRHTYRFELLRAPYNISRLGLPSEFTFGSRSLHWETNMKPTFLLRNIRPGLDIGRTGTGSSEEQILDRFSHEVDLDTGSLVKASARFYRPCATPFKA